MDLGVIGGPQGPKSLLDAVRQAVREGNLDTLSRLSKEFLAVNDNVEKCRDENGNTIVHLALDKNPTTLEYVIDTLHASINATNAQGRTPLHEAVTRDLAASCQLLLDNGADDTIQSTTQSTPFHTAAACGSVDCMEVILRHSDKPEVKVNELDRQRSSALHKCAFDGDVRVSRWLVDHGASIDVADATDATPLLIAVKMGQTEVVEFLLSKGADCNRQDRQGNSGLHYCAVRCDVGVARLLLAAGAKPRLVNEEFNSPLHIVAQHARPDSGVWEEMVGLLLLAGCDPQQVNASNKKPSDYVSRGLKKIFTKEDVERRQRREAQQQAESDAELARAWEQCAQWKTKVLENVAVRRAWEAAEDERLAREKEERIRAANDARMTYDEALEKCRFQEAEIQRKKALLEKASAKTEKLAREAEGMKSVKERDVAGMAAFELALQYSYIRQDRSYHLMQLLTAICSFVFFSQLTVLNVLLVLPPLVPSVEPHVEFLRAYSHPVLAVLSLVALLLIRASKKRFVIEPGEQTMERLNRDVLEPCLGMKFDTQSGKLYSDLRAGSLRGRENYYSLRYLDDQPPAPATATETET